MHGRSRSTQADPKPQVSDEQCPTSAYGALLSAENEAREGRVATGSRFPVISSLPLSSGKQTRELPSVTNTNLRRFAIGKMPTHSFLKSFLGMRLGHNFHCTFLK